MNPQSELHRADPGLRRLARWLPATVLIIAVLALWSLHRWLESIDGQGQAVPNDALLLLFLGLAVIVSCVGMTLGWLLWGAADRVRAEDCYPSSDTRTLRDVPLRRGQAAKTASIGLRAAAIATASAGAAVLAWALLSARSLL